MLTYKCILDDKDVINITSFSEPEIGQIILTSSGEELEIKNINLINEKYYITTK
jgi:hypothetical protein